MNFFTVSKKRNLGIPCVWFIKDPYISQILLKLCLIGNRTLRRPILSVFILVIRQIALPLRGRPILLITRMITDRIRLHPVLLQLLTKIFTMQEMAYTTCSAHFFKFNQWNPLPEVRVTRNLVIFRKGPSANIWNKGQTKTKSKGKREEKRKKLIVTSYTCW